MVGAPVAGPKARGFTLLELLIVVVVLGILAAVVIPRLTVSAAEARKTTCAQNKAIIRTQVDRWHLEKGTWPANDLSDIAADPAYFPEGIPKCPVDGKAYKLHPALHIIQADSH